MNRCPKCDKVIEGGHERDGAELCWCSDDEEETVTYNASKPGREFIPDGEGGGTLYITEKVRRPGFRPQTRTLIIKKSPLVG